MDNPPIGFRELRDALLDYEGTSLVRDLLAPWIAANADELDWLQRFGSRSGSPIPPASEEDLWELYALSRVNDTLLLPFQRGEADGSPWPGPPISLEEYLAFVQALGLTVTESASFSPFHHEIVEVEQAEDDAEPVVVLDSHWPGLMLGDMLVSRAGVRVRSGRALLRKESAESSTLYWASRRKNRPYEDLSQGWGGNSQWRTNFRRDYRLGSSFYFNVDGKHDLAELEPGLESDRGLTREERTEMLLHRCFVTTTKPHSDPWPYHDRLCLEV